MSALSNDYSQNGNDYCGYQDADPIDDLACIAEELVTQVMKESEAQERLVLALMI